MTLFNYLMHLPHVSVFYLLYIYFTLLHCNELCFIHCFNMDQESAINVYILYKILSSSCLWTLAHVGSLRNKYYFFLLNFTINNFAPFSLELHW